MSNVLVVCYAIAWASCAFVGATHAPECLGLAAALLTFPFFLFNSLRFMLVGFLITTVLVSISFLFPPLAFLSGAWMVINMVLKLLRFARNLIPMAAGVGLYILLGAAPQILNSAFGNSGWPQSGWYQPVMVPVLFCIGAAIMTVALLPFERLGYRRNLAAAMMLGFPAYLVIFVLTSMTPGMSDSPGDFDGFDT
jgi:hypothetical protein